MFICKLAEVTDGYVSLWLLIFSPTPKARLEKHMVIHRGKTLSIKDIHGGKTFLYCIRIFMEEHRSFLSVFVDLHLEHQD